MRRNLLDVFNEPDPERRSAAIAQTYAEDVVWHEPDRVVRGREALAERATELRTQTPDWVFRPEGPVSVNDDPRSPRLPVRSGRPTARCDRNGHRPLQGRRHHRALHHRHRNPPTLLGCVARDQWVVARPC
ncbi:nuclear transport factor 2 family protein [Streptomyces mirabilis]|uniref:nuclear transport factor 2 family protein n=1 Tax=Streptomyces mirabilis TaxID=68239 RepID=UPI003675DC5B